MTSAPPLRVAVIGARQRRQGIGAHLARFCAQAGAEVVAVLGTTGQTAAEAADLLRASTGQSAQPHTDWEALIEATAPGAVVIAGPHETHAEYLHRAFQADVHVLCEKPLVWEPPWHGQDPEATLGTGAEGLATMFLAEGLHLAVNTQWPFTLPSYARLYRDPRKTVPERFTMRLSPRSAGRAMLVDAMPHPLSLLAAVLPDEHAELEDVAVQFLDEGRRATVTFTYIGAGTSVAAEVELQQRIDQPRPAGYGFDGRFVRRHVDMPSYTFAFESKKRRIPLPDPTPLLVRSFLAAVAAGPPQEPHPAVVPGMRHLAQIVVAAPNSGATQP